MSKAKLRIVEPKDAFPDRQGKRLSHALLVPVCRPHRLDRGSSQRCGEQQHLVGLSREPSEPPAEQLSQAVRDSQRLSGLRSCVRTDEFPPELQREEGVATGQLAHLRELGSRQLEPEPLAQKVV